MFRLIGKLIKWSWNLGAIVYILGRFATSWIISTLVSEKIITSLEQKVIAIGICTIFFFFLQLVWIFCFLIRAHYKNKMKKMQQQYAQPQYAQQPPYYYGLQQQPQYNYAPPSPSQHYSNDDTINYVKTALEKQQQMKELLSNLKNLDKYKNMSDNDIIRSLYYENVQNVK